MKYCPVCREEFVDSVSVCPDDHVKLVDHLEPEVHEEDMPREILYEFSDQKLAEMVQNVLEDNDIVVFLKSDMFSSAMSVHGASPVGTHIKMMVARSEMERARELTQGMFETEDGNDT